MSTPRLFIFGGLIGLIGFAALIAAAQIGTGFWYVLGLAVAGVCWLVVMGMIWLGSGRTPRGPVRTEGPMPLSMAAHNSIRSPVPTLPQPVRVAEVKQGPGLWDRAGIWIRGGLAVLVAAIALILAASWSGFWQVAAIVLFLLSVFYVFRLVHDPRDGRLIPHFAPARPGARFALGGLFGAIAIVALLMAGGGGAAESVALIVCGLFVLLIFILIGQSWDGAKARQR